MNVVRQVLTKIRTKGGGRVVDGLRSAMQEVAIAGLHQKGFFRRAAFSGGSCLRIVHGSPRFSDTLEFCWLEPDEDLLLEPLFRALRTEFASFGLDIVITLKKRMPRIGSETGTLKKNARCFVLSVPGEETLNITFEIDLLSYPGFSTEEKRLPEPFPFQIRCVSLPDLFAATMHHLLFGNSNSFINGPDWFDFEWFIKNSVPLNLPHVARIAGLHSVDRLSDREFQLKLAHRIDSLDVTLARSSVNRSIDDLDLLNRWSRHYFHELAHYLIISV